MELLALPAFSDNYIWMLHDGREALVVDPGEAAPVEHALEKHCLRLRAILVTHHHADHVGGIDTLRGLLQGPVLGPRHEHIPEPCDPVGDGDGFRLLGLHFAVIGVPGHTAGHIAYFTQPVSEAPMLFCGDTLFSAGCGRLFEGTPAQMHASLERLMTLPGDTRVCCAHEYTLSNLLFAQAVEPGNADVATYAGMCEDLRRIGRPTLPSTLARERCINPFVRLDSAEVRRAALAYGAQSDAKPDLFEALRRWKNAFQ